MAAAARAAPAAAAATDSAAGGQTPPARALRHPLIELLARYRAVLAAAWGLRTELAGPKRLADEAAFLPAALAMQETPVHPAPRRAMALIVALSVLALLWSVLGQEIGRAHV
jgi:hemolysin D